MAALFSRAAGKGTFLKNLPSSFTKRHLSIAVSHDPGKNFKKCYERKTNLLYSACFKNSSAVLGTRFLSSETGGEFIAESVANNTFLTDVISNSSDVLNNVGHTLNSLGEPTLTSLGLGGWSPVGLAQQAVELIHTSLNIPWGWSIVATTVVIRLLIFPLIVTSQVQMARLNNIKPEMNKYQEQLKELENTYRSNEAAQVQFKMQKLLKDNKCNPLKGFLAPIVQLPTLVSFLMGLQRMANLPVESLQSGGWLWFQDLTVSDPYFVLPVLCGFSMLAVVEASGRTGLSSELAAKLKNVLRVLCILAIPLTARFPAGVATYWLSSNIFTLGQVSLLQVKPVRKFFGIPERKVQEQTADQGIINYFKDVFNKSKNTAYVKHHEKMKRQQAKAMGKYVQEPTYDFNPLKDVGQTETPIADKRRKGKNNLRSKPGQTM